MITAIAISLLLALDARADNPAPEFVGVSVRTDSGVIKGYVFREGGEPAIEGDGQKFFQLLRERGNLYINTGLFEADFLGERVFASTDLDWNREIPISSVKSIELTKLPFSGRKLNLHSAGYIPPRLLKKLKTSPVYSCVLRLYSSEDVYFISFNKAITEKEMAPLCKADMSNWKDLEKKFLKQKDVFRQTIHVPD